MVNLEFDLDTMMQEADVSLHKSSVGHSLGSKDRLSFLCKPQHGLFGTEEFSPFNYSDDFTDLVGDDELFFRSRESKRHVWDATSRSLPCDILDENDFGSSYGNWMDPMDATADCFYGKNNRKKEFSFQGSYRPKSRTTMRESGNLEPTDSPYLRLQKSENFHNYKLPDMSWHSPVKRHYDARHVVGQATQPCHIYEDARDSMSLPSEESCSSSAVRGIRKKGTLNSLEKEALESIDVAYSENYIPSEYNMSGWEDNRNKWKISRGNITRPVKFTKMTNPSRSTPGHDSNTNGKRLKPEKGLSDTAFGPGKASSGCDSYFQVSETRKPSSWGAKLWTEDLFGTSRDPKSYESERFFETFCKLSADCAPCSKFESQKHNFHKPNRSSMLDLSDCNVEFRHPKSFHDQSCLASEHLSTTREADEDSGVHAPEHGKLVPERDTSRCRKSSSSEIGKSSDAADVEDKCSAFEEFTDGTSRGVKDTICPEFAGETSPAAETSNFVDGDQCYLNTTELDAPTALLCHTGVEVEGFCPERRQKETDKIVST